MTAAPAFETMRDEPQTFGLPGVSKRKSIRILHIVERLGKQAVESWLLRVMRQAQEEYPEVHWSFFCTDEAEGTFDHEVRALGGDVINSRYEIGDKVRFFRSLRAVMQRGAFDILHCHHDVMSAAYLLASTALPIQKRI